jgi:hypothetical protein
MEAIRKSLPTVAVLSALSLLALAPAHLAAQPPDVIPRSVFLPVEGDAEQEPVIECHPNHCKFYDGGFDSTPVWTHTTNTSRQKLWLEVCASNSDGAYLYGHYELRPGETLWVTVRIPKGHWGWIQTWAILPELQPQEPQEETPKEGVLVEITQSSSTEAEDPLLGTIRVNETVGTVQMARSPFGPPRVSAMNLAPGPDTPAWSVQTAHGGDAGTTASDDGWRGDGRDPRLDRAVRNRVRHFSDGFLLIQEDDADRDGRPEHVSRLRFQHKPNEKRLVLTTFDDGRRSLVRTVTKTHDGDREIRRILTDRDGNGTIDSREVEVGRTVDGVTWVERRRDLDADGTLDEVERMRLSYYGPRHSAQLTEIFDGAGKLKDKIAIRTTPTAEGYRIVTLHDENGDAVYDSKELQISLVGPFGQGIDIDTLKIDLGNDGSFESSHTSVAHKNLGPDSYRETVKSDIGSDGTVEAVTRRTARFAPRQE